MAFNPGKITVYQGGYSNETTAQYDLIANQATYPEIREVLDYVQRRNFTTLLTSGAVTPYGINYKKQTKIPNVETKGSKGIGNDFYQFRIMGKIERTSTILAQIGGSNADGTFTLKMLANEIFPGDMALFYGGRRQARVMSAGRASAGGWLFDFQTPTREAFDWDVWVAPQTGTKTLFVSHTGLAEQSLRGYGYDKFPDMFGNHMTTQRMETSITGDANAQRLWVEFTNAANGKTGKGWIAESAAQLRAKASMRDERAMWFGVSTMKNTDGTLRATSNLTDPANGRPIIMGDGYEEQVAGGNVGYGSGTNGRIVLQDMIDMMSTLKQKGDLTTGYIWCAVTGSDGYFNFQQEAVNLLGNQNIQIMQAIGAEEKAGSADVSAGYNFCRINFGGNSLYVMEHPMFDDLDAYPELTGDGTSVLGSTMFVFPVGSEANLNMEILHKEGHGANRSWVEATFNGMTGAPEMIISKEDAKTYAVLWQKMLAVYNTQVCGIIYPNT